MAEQIRDIIAERKLTFVESNGTNHPCRLIFGRPVEYEKNCFKCEFQIIGYGNDKVYNGNGVDSLQALTLAIERANLETTYHDYDGKFFLHSSNELDLVARDLR